MAEAEAVKELETERARMRAEAEQTRAGELEAARTKAQQALQEKLAAARVQADKALAVEVAKVRAKGRARAGGGAGWCARGSDCQRPRRRVAGFECRLQRLLDSVRALDEARSLSQVLGHTDRSHGR